MNLKFDGWPRQNNRAPLLYHVKLCPSFQSHRWIQNETTVWKRSILVKIDKFVVLCDHEILWMTLKNKNAPLPNYFKLCVPFPRVTLYTAGHLHTAVPHCSHSRAPIVHTAVPRENNEHGCVYLRCRAVCKLPGCVEGHPWFRCHWWIQIGGTDRKHQITVKIDNFLAVWPWNLMDCLENYRAHFLSNTKLSASFDHHIWI